MKRKIIIFILLIVTCELKYSFCQTNISIGKPAPKVKITEWILNIPKNKSFKNKYIVLDFWATWCKPCLASVPHLNELNRKFSSEDVVFVSITNEPPTVINRTLKKVNFQTVVVTDESNTTFINFGDGMKGLSYYPMTVLIDNSNVIKWIGNSANLSDETLGKFISNKNIEPKKFPDNQNIINKQDFELNKNEEYTLEWWSDLYHNSELSWFAYIEEESINFQENSSATFGNGSYFENISLIELLRIIFPKKRFNIPHEHQNIKYRFIHINKNPSSESGDKLLNEIIDQLNFQTLRKESTDTNFFVKVKKKELLKESSHKGFDSYFEDGSGNLIIRKQSLSDLFNILSQKTDYYWAFVDNKKINSNKKFEFKINMNSTESIINSLESYGLKVKKKLSKVETIYITPEIND